MHNNKNKFLLKSSRFNQIGWPKIKYFYECPYQHKKYFEFFNNYAKKKYTFKPTTCLCKNKDDLTLSLNDRSGVEFITVICQSCGLIRAKNYFTDNDAMDFYSNHFWKIESALKDHEHENPEDIYENLRITGIEKSGLIKKFLNVGENKPVILDVGGRIGGVLENFKSNCRLVLADYFQPYLDYAKSKNIETINGGLGDIDFKPDVIILSHVIEHWTNFEDEMQNLIKIQKVNHTLTYIEFPGIDSLKNGRRDGDLLGDLYLPHCHYFTSYVFEDIMNRYGFEKVYLDSAIRGIFKYTGNKKNTVCNHFIRVKNDLIDAENKRFKYTLQSKIRKHVPRFLLNLLRNIRKPRNTSE